MIATVCDTIEGIGNGTGQDIDAYTDIVWMERREGWNNYEDALYYNMAKLHKRAMVKRHILKI